MIGSVSSRYALRSLRRHLRRTLLSIVGVGVGCAMGVFASSWVAGACEMQIRAASESGAGHVRVVPAEWPEKRDNTSRLTDADAVLAAAQAQPGATIAAPRARANGLLAFGNRTAGVEIVGVDPAAELQANRIVYKSELEGRYLQAGDRNAVAIGAAVAERLNVELDDDLYATFAGKDDIGSAMLRIVGILKTGSRDIDATICHVTLEDLGRITGLRGAGEVSILLEDYRRIARTRAALEEKLGPAYAVITWAEVNPGLAANVEGDTAFTRGLIGMIVLIVALGIASAQMTAVLERRHEFAILTALGMKARHVIGLMTLEALIIGVSGAVVAMAVGGGVAYWLATHGVDFAALMGEDFSIENVMLDPVLYGDFGPWIVGYALSVSVIATLVASVLPAWHAVRIDPADSLRTI